VDESDWFGMSPYVDDHNDSIYIVYQKPVGEQEDGEVFFIKSDILDIVNNRVNLPTIDFKLSPNPFSQKVRIEYKINETNNTTIKIYSLTGQLIKTLYQGKIEQGEYQIFWDGTTQSGTPAKDGTYLIRIRVGNKIKTKSVELIR
jgi:flagellar hook assembly protein FlgD